MTSYVDQTGEWETRKISILGALASFINQLSIGEDLTKISIPSVLLCPYSALELAGLRALIFVDMLVRASREEDPLKRFLGVLKFVIAYTQKEKTGKKPYNPILAETHLSWVDHTGTDVKGITKFLAEQVSHHPPATSYITENAEEGLRVRTTSVFSTHFYGNSVSAIPSGRTLIDFLKLDEQYELPKPMPDLSVKNVVIGTRRHSWEGELSLICQKTGYKAVLNFFEDGWWCINSVTGYIVKLDNPDKRLFTFQGVLGETITLTNTQTSTPEVLVDLTKAVRQKIKYLPWEKLSDKSSVKVWRELSESIVKDDMNAADVAKKAVEDAQRKRRKENTSFVPEYFKYDEQTTTWDFVMEKLPEIDKQIATANDPVPKQDSVEVKQEDQKPADSKEGQPKDNSTSEGSKPGEIVDVKV